MQAGASVLQKFAYAASASALQAILPLAGKTARSIRQSVQTGPLSH